METDERKKSKIARNFFETNKETKMKVRICIDRNKDLTTLHNFYFLCDKSIINVPYCLIFTYVLEFTVITILFKLEIDIQYCITLCKA